MNNTTAGVIVDDRTGPLPVRDRRVGGFCRITKTCSGLTELDRAVVATGAPNANCC